MAYASDYGVNVFFTGRGAYQGVPYEPHTVAFVPASTLVEAYKVFDDLHDSGDAASLCVVDKYDNEVLQWDRYSD